MLSLWRISAGNISWPFVEMVVFINGKITSYIVKVTSTGAAMYSCTSHPLSAVHLNAQPADN